MNCILVQSKMVCCDLCRKCCDLLLQPRRQKPFVFTDIVARLRPPGGSIPDLYPAPQFKVQRSTVQSSKFFPAHLLTQTSNFRLVSNPRLFAVICGYLRLFAPIRGMNSPSSPITDYPTTNSRRLVSLPVQTPNRSPFNFAQLLIGPDRSR